MRTQTEYQLEYPSGRVIRIEIENNLIQVFDHKPNCELYKKSKVLTLQDLIQLLPEYNPKENQ